MQRDVVAEFLAAHDVTQLIQRGETPDPGDVAAAVNGYCATYDYLLDDAAP